MSWPSSAQRRLGLLLALDAALFACSWAGAHVIRFDLVASPSLWSSRFDRTLLIVVAFKVAAFAAGGAYRTLLRYAGIPDLLLIVRNSTLTSLAVLAFLDVAGRRPLSRGALVIDWMLTIGLLAASRIAWRVSREGLLTRRSRVVHKHVLIAGAGRAGAALAKDLIATRRSELEVIGFVDDDPAKQGSTLLGLKVLGTTKDLAEIPRCRPVDQVIVAIPSAPPSVLRRIAGQVKAVDDVRVVPRLDALLRGKAEIVQSEPVCDGALLRRDAVELAAAGLARFLEGKTVLVTGAGGSIGGELARQLARREDRPLRKLILLDCAETPLYEIERQTAATLGSRVLAVLASVRDMERMADLLRGERPDVVLHAAALKHVPMCERYPLEAIVTNTWATARLAELARDEGVANFTLVSTDKAVAPACVMGATKRAAERYVQSLAGQSATRFAAVRFGNVLGSNGSVVPLFQEQIARGGPVTITDPRMTRFFMTIPEACGLILQATHAAQGGEIYVLDMGEPVRVLDIAHSLIRLSGYEPGRDIEVRIIGPRPGEKLQESLVDEAEEAERLPQAKLLRIRGSVPDPGRLRELLSVLEWCLEERDEQEALRVLRALVPNFHWRPQPERQPGTVAEVRVPA
ncbi:MAG: polysaccharide biosynthesis protein [Betaproteobacteria bacterium]